MSENSTPKPAAPGGNPDLIDLVAGDPPVPITVWRTARSDHDPSATISARLAYRLVAAYSLPGDAVIDLTDTHALTGACLRGERRHHKAWFTDPAALTIGPSTPSLEHEAPDDAPDRDPGELPEPAA